MVPLGIPTDGGSICANGALLMKVEGQATNNKQSLRKSLKPLGESTGFPRIPWESLGNYLQYES